MLGHKEDLGNLTEPRVGCVIWRLEGLALDVKKSSKFKALSLSVSAILWVCFIPSLFLLIDFLNLILHKVKSVHFTLF